MNFARSCDVATGGDGLTVELAVSRLGAEEKDFPKMSLAIQNCFGIVLVQQ